MFIQPAIKDRVNSFLKKTDATIGHALGLEFTSFKIDELKGSMPVDERTIQPFGILHGGASVVLAESLASVGAWLNVQDEHKTAVGIEINANHLRAVPKGNEVHAVSTPVKCGRKIHVWKTQIFNNNNELTCTSRCTLAIVDK